jgi:hypothetical protein
MALTQVTYALQAWLFVVRVEQLSGRHIVKVTYSGLR